MARGTWNIRKPANFVAQLLIGLINSWKFWNKFWKTLKIISQYTLLLKYMLYS